MVSIYQGRQAHGTSQVHPGVGGRCRSRRPCRRPGAGRQVEDAVDVELGGAHLQGVRGPLQPHQQALRRQARDHAVRRRRGHRRVRDARCGQRRRAARPLLVARLLLRQGPRAGRHQRLRLRLPAPVAGRGLVPPEGRPRHAARGLRQVQRLPGRRQLVGRGIDRRQEADQEHGRLQGREVPLAARHDGRDPDQARRLDRRAARAARSTPRSTRASSTPPTGRRSR